MKDIRIFDVRLWDWIVLLLAIGVILAVGLLFYRVFGPGFQQAERAIFQESQQFIAGMNQDLGRRCTEYTAETDNKAKYGIGQYILDQAAQVADETHLTQAVQQCLSKVRAEMKGAQ